MVRFGDLKLHKIEDIMAQTGVSKDTLVSYVKLGKLKGNRLGRSLLITDESLREFLGAETETCAV